MLIYFRLVLTQRLWSCFLTYTFTNLLGLASNCTNRGKSLVASSRSRMRKTVNFGIPLEPNLFLPPAGGLVKIETRRRLCNLLRKQFYLPFLLCVGRGADFGWSPKYSGRDFKVGEWEAGSLKGKSFSLTFTRTFCQTARLRCRDEAIPCYAFDQK